MAAVLVVASYGGVLGTKASALPSTSIARVVTKLPAAKAAKAKHAAGSAKTVAPAATGTQPFPGAVDGETSQVVSVVADTAQSRSATLQLWQRGEDTIWRPVGRPVTAEVGAGGLTRTPTDYAPQTPIGTWALDVVLARDPGITRMPEHVLVPGDGWSSCTSCADYDRLSNSNEMWAGRDSWSRVAVHVVTNPKRIPGLSSGIFIHVGEGRPSAGCVAVPVTKALEIARWLDPQAAPKLVVAVRR